MLILEKLEGLNPGCQPQPQWKKEIAFAEVCYRIYRDKGEWYW